MIRIVAALSALLLSASLAFGDEPTVLNLWPETAPGETGAVGEETIEPSKPEERSQRKITNVTRPTIAVFPAPRETNTGAAVVIAPGGGYNILAYDLEGEEVAAWLNSIGVTGIVLKYRVPRRPDQPRDRPLIGALQDAQRAMSLVRSKAEQWDIDPRRIGMLGFSAGGHLTAWTATNANSRAYESIDEVDRVSSRPDFAVMVYPGGLRQREHPDVLNEEIRVNAQTPPCFFAHADDDRVSSANSALMYLALKRAGVSAELHIFASGGHGFGLRPSDKPCSTWPRLCAGWLKDQGWLTPTP